jgi:hypothetical protein
LVVDATSSRHADDSRRLPASHLDELIIGPTTFCTFWP